MHHRIPGKSYWCLLISGYPEVVQGNPTESMPATAHIQSIMYVNPEWICRAD